MTTSFAPFFNQIADLPQGGNHRIADKFRGKFLAQIDKFSWLPAAWAQFPCCIPEG